MNTDAKKILSLGLIMQTEVLTENCCICYIFK